MNLLLEVDPTGWDAVGQLIADNFFWVGIFILFALMILRS